MQRFVKERLGGWGRFPVEPCHVYRPEKRAELPEILGSGQQPSYISRGLGRSYGDPAINKDAGVISHLALNRFLAFDESTGDLECEAGASLAEILEFAVPRGYFLPVTPGTKFVTLGGAIAADVHGKNHHRDGTIANHIGSFRLLTPTGSVLTCSASENTDVYWATMGGMGLTGIVLSATLRLRRVDSAFVLVDYLKAKNLDAALEAFEVSDRDYRYSVAWIDCLAGGGALGRSVLMRGNDAPRERLRVRDPLRVAGPPRWNMPVELPGMALNPLSIGLFNKLFYLKHRNLTGQVVHYEPFFYPLDMIADWNRMYGRRGFVQYQAVFPLANGRAGLVEVLEALVRSKRASFLAVLKRFGDANPGPLSFPTKGYTLSLDIPNSAGLVPFLHGLDTAVLRHGGRVYLAKDAALTAESFAAMYPRAEEFRAIQRRLDPEGRLASSLARRVGLVAAEVRQAAGVAWATS